MGRKGAKSEGLYRIQWLRPRRGKGPEGGAGAPPAEPEEGLRPLTGGPYDPDEFRNDPDVFEPYDPRVFEPYDPIPKQREISQQLIAIDAKHGRDHGPAFRRFAERWGHLGVGLAGETWYVRGEIGGPAAVPLDSATWPMDPRIWDHAVRELATASWLLSADQPAALQLIEGALGRHTAPERDGRRRVRSLLGVAWVDLSRRVGAAVAIEARCIQCGDPRDPRRRFYCTDACKQQAYRRRDAPLEDYFGKVGWKEAATLLSARFPAKIPLDPERVRRWYEVWTLKPEAQGLHGEARRGLRRESEIRKDLLGRIAGEDAAAEEARFMLKESLSGWFREEARGSSLR